MDIDPFAVNIARLRLWLSLVVDFEGDDPPPLPNLDFKIEAGDSLTAPDPSGGANIDIFRKGQIDEFFDLKTAYLKAPGEEKKRLRKQIDDLREQIAEWAQHDGDTSNLDWQVEFAEVFASGGFDVILANPPYVRQELIGDLKPTLKTVFPEVYPGAADLYVYFYARALQLLKRGGMLAFISSNKWFRAGYGKKLRKHVADTCHVRSITDFGDLPVFQSATAYPMIFAAQKDNKRNELTTFTEVASLDPPYPDVATLVRQVGEMLPPEAINGEDWLLIDAETAARIAGMRASGITLGEYVEGQVYRGVVTGFNEAFVIDGAKREELLSQDPTSAEIIKPFAVGKDVQRWTVNYRDRWLIFTRRGINIGRYPAIRVHLAQWEAELTPRKTGQEKVGRKPGPYKWYEIQDTIAYHSVFERPKIMYNKFQVRSKFSYDSAGALTNDAVFFFPVDDFYLLGF